MDIYSPSHPTDQDLDIEESPKGDVEKIPGSNRDNQNHSKGSCASRTPELSPTLSISSGTPVDVLAADKKNSGNSDVPGAGPSPCVDLAVLASNVESKKSVTRNESVKKNDCRTPSKASGSKNNGDKKNSSSKMDNCKLDKDRSREDGSRSSHRDSSRHVTSRSSRHRSRSPKRRQSRSPRRSSRKRSRSRSYRGSHYRRWSRSRDRHRRRSRSVSREHRNGHRRDSRRDRQTRSRSRNSKNFDVHASGTRKESNEVNSTLPAPSDSSQGPSTDKAKSENAHSVDQYDMDETSTPDILEDQNQTFNNGSVRLVFSNQPAPSTLPNPPGFLSWQQPLQQQQPHMRHPFNQPHALQQLPSAMISNIIQQQHVQPPNFQPNRPPNLMSQRPNFNLANVTRSSGMPPNQFLPINGMFNPLLSFSGIVGQPPPPPSLPSSLGYTVPPPPPPPFPVQQLNNSNFALPQQQPPLRTTPPPPPPPLPPQNCPNLIETLMSKAGLPTDGIASLSSASATGRNLSDLSMAAIPLPEPSRENPSPTKKLNKLLGSAASNLLSKIKIPGGLSVSPPPPPPPLPATSNLAEPSFSPLKVAPIPLPPLTGTSGASGGRDRERKHGHHREPDPEFVAKRRRSEFENSHQWKDRIALEVKTFIKPYYASQKVSKEDCRTVFKKSVHKIYNSGCTTINREKIGNFVKAYLRKYYNYRKLQAQRRKLQAESVARN